MNFFVFCFFTALLIDIPLNSFLVCILLKSIFRISNYLLPGAFVKMARRKFSKNSFSAS